MRLRLLFLPVFGLMATLALSADSGPAVTAAGAVIMDAGSGKVLWGKNPDTARFPASTTKVMTGLLLVERTRPDDILTAPPDVETITGSSLHLKPGERVTAREMLYALMLRSANDGCYTVALHLAGNVPAFAKLMNQRAQQIGCKHTHFSNPHGLNDGTHLTTPHDLALMAREAMRHPDFAETVAASRHSVVRSANKEDLLLVNKNKLLKQDSTVEGIKTGWTVPAGHCFVGAATRNGYRLITVVMKSEDWAADTEAMLDWAFKRHERVRLLESGTLVSEQPVRGGKSRTVPIKPSGDVWTVVRKGASRDAKFFMKGELRSICAPFSSGLVVGRGFVTDSEGFTQPVGLVTGAEVRRRPIAARVFSPTGLVVVAALAGGAWWVRRKPRRLFR